MKPHYYVMRVGYSGAPTVKHKTLEEAQREAERLAAKWPGESFEILQCLGVSSTMKATTFWCDGCVPF